MELVKLSTAYTAVIRDHHTQGVHKVPPHPYHSVNNASPKHQNGTPILTRYSLDSPYIPDIEQFPSAVQ